MRPKVLSIHPTMQCDYECYNCYLKVDIDDSLKERDPAFFLGLVDKAKALGMQEVALPVNFVKKDPNFKFLDDPSPVWNRVDQNVYYYKWVKERCKEVGIDFSMTCNYDFITSYRDHIDFNDIRLMSISINDFVTHTAEKKKEAIATMREMKKFIPEINCNLLLTDNMAKQLNEGLAEEILEVADTIYLLVSVPLYVEVKKIHATLRKLKDTLLTMVDDRILLDTCLKQEMGMTGGMCSKHDMIYINPYGEIKLCSYDSRNLFVLDTPKDLEYVYRTFYPAAPLKTCELVNGEWLQKWKKNLRTKRSNRVLNK